MGPTIETLTSQVERLERELAAATQELSEKSIAAFPYEKGDRILVKYISRDAPTEFEIAGIGWQRLGGIRLMVHPIKKDGTPSVLKIDVHSRGIITEIGKP